MTRFIRLSLHILVILYMIIPAMPGYADDLSLTLSGIPIEAIAVAKGDTNLRVSLGAAILGEPVLTEQEHVISTTYLWTASPGSVTPSNSSSVTWSGVFTTKGPKSVGVSCTATILIAAPDGGQRTITLNASGTIPFDVKVKTWQAFDIIKPGHMVAPQDQSDPDSSKWKPKKVKVVVGNTLGCAADGAVDKDKWSLLAQSGIEEDSVEYTWSCGYGKFLVGHNSDGTPIYAATAKGAAATYVAPNDPCLDTVSYSVDDKPLPIGDDEDGSRDDGSVGGGSVVVHVVGAPSHAYIAFYQDENGTIGNEVSGTIGDNVYVALMVSIGVGQHMVNCCGPIRVEEISELHKGDNTRYFDITPNIASAWEKYNTVSHAWEAGNPSSPNNTGVSVLYRLRATLWNTASSPKGHNGAHTVGILPAPDGTPDDADNPNEMQFQDYAGGEGPYYSGPATEAVDVQNVVITKAISGDGSLDYIKYDPDNEDPSISNPTVCFSFLDKANHNACEYEWTVSYINTTSTEIYQTQGTLTATNGGDVVASIPSDLSFGTYGFQIVIIKKHNGNSLGTIYLRSGLLNFANDQIDISDDGKIASFKYTIVPRDIGCNNLQDAKLYALDGIFKLLRAYDGDTTHSIEHSIDISDLKSDNPGEGRLIITGLDNEISRYRDHIGHRLIPRNRITLNYQVKLFIGPKVGGYVDTAGGDISVLTNTLIFKTSTNKPAFLSFSRESTAPTPTIIWANIVKLTQRKTSAKKLYSPYIIYSIAHSNSAVHEISY